MPIQIVDGFSVIPSEKGLALAIESDRIEECMKYALDKGISRVFLHSYDGYNDKNVDFLESYDFITEISITDESIEMSGVHYLSKLKYLSLSNGKQLVDLTKFRYLEEVSIDWNNKIIGLDSMNHIEKMSLWKFKPKTKDFTLISGCKSLKYLHITESNIESFRGIEKLQALDHLEGHYLSKLENLDGLETLASSLKILVFDYCRKLNNYESVLGELKKLEKLVLGDCGAISSLEFVHSLKRLNFLSFVNTNIVDGDIGPALKLKLEYIGFDSKRHYTHKWEDVKK